MTRRQNLFAAALVCAAAVSAGCSDAPPAAEPEDVVYRCEETGELVLAAPQTVPAMHPRTGHPTLYRALYCPKCQSWQVVPPPDVFNGRPEAYPCPRHQSVMQVNGPLPNESQRQNTIPTR